MKNKSRKISYLLRHNPEDLSMSKDGWVLVSDLLSKLDMSKDDLEYIVFNNDKKRFSFNEDGTKIRANQGHSSKLKVDIEMDEVKFPGIYYHGTTFENMNSILKHGLNSGTRNHVHLSKDIPTAVNVGNRHIKTGSTVVILEINASQMKHDGYKIYESKNGVILVDFVPSKYISTH